MLFYLASAFLVGVFVHDATKTSRFKNIFYPVESGHFEKIGRNRNFGFIRGEMPAYRTYQNPLPYRVVNEFNDKLSETNWGYATKTFQVTR